LQCAPSFLKFSSCVAISIKVSKVLIVLRVGKNPIMEFGCKGSENL
jgi:hypothetical protein